MTKVKDTGSIAKTITELTGKTPETIAEKDAFNYLMPVMTKLYNLIQPSLTTIQSNNLIYFNSNEEYDDNAYYNQLIDYYHNASATFSNLIDLRRNMLIGDGLKPVQENDQATLEFLNRPNEFGETLLDIWEKLCFDFSLFESYALEVLYSPKNKGTVDSVVHHSPDTVRAVANDNPNLNYVNVWQLSKAWGRTNKTGKYVKPATQGIPIANWNPFNWASDGARQLLVCKRYSAGNEVYAIPSFNSILSYVELDAQLARYSLSTVSKGFTPQTIVVLAGNPDKKSKDEFVNRFKSRYSGADGERVLFIWTTDENSKPQIMPFQQVDITPLLQALIQITTEKIASGMGATPELAGVVVGGQSNLQSDYNKLGIAYSYYYKRTILPFQLQMINTLNKIMRVNGLSDLTVTTPPLILDLPTQPAQSQPNTKSIM